jgi:hypothetical protein
MMVLDEIRRLHQAVPFRPFSIQLENGRKIRVKRPENLGYSSRGSTLSIFEGEAGDLINLQDIVKVQGPKAAPRRQAQRNGHDN